jgi:arylsulfatase A-like enzyme
MFWSLLFACTSAPVSLPSKPDIVVVVVDTLRADHLGVYGHHRATSPFMDGLAAQGSWFSRAYASSGWTLPSMASLLSGLYPHQHLVGRLAFRGSEFGKLDAEVMTLAESLAGQGYATGAVVNNTFMAPAFSLDQGFDLYSYAGATNTAHRSAAETVSAGLAWLDGSQGPGFLFLHFMEPHLNYAATEPHLGRFSAGNPAASEIKLEDLVGKSHRSTPPTAEVQEYVRQRYDEEIRVADDAVRQLVAELKARGRYENTILVITSDHGEEFWDHGGFEHGHTLMGELTRVPLILAGAVPNHGRVDAVVEHVDLVAGLLASSGASATAVPGTDLWGIAAGTAKDHDNVALSENILYGPPKVSLVDADARLEFSFEDSRGSLWGVDTDGAERRRVAPELRQAAGARLSAAIKAKRGSLLPIEGVGGVTIADREMFNQLQSLGYIDGPDPGSDPSAEVPATASDPTVAVPTP